MIRKDHRSPDREGKAPTLKREKAGNLWRYLKDGENEPNYRRTKNSFQKSNKQLKEGRMSPREKIVIQLGEKYNIRIRVDMRRGSNRTRSLEDIRTRTTRDGTYCHEK